MFGLFRLRKAKAQALAEEWIRELSTKYNLAVPEIEVDNFYLNQIRAQHIYNQKTKECYIKIDFAKITSKKQLKHSVYHEFRHYWQWEHYPDLSIWFPTQTAYKNNEQFYKCSLIEFDANRFAESLGTKDDNTVMEAFTLQQLQYLYSHYRLSVYIGVVSEKLLNLG